MVLELYHNPRCSKSREALRLLRERGYDPKLVLYLETPPTAARLKSLLKSLGMEARELLRRSEPIYAQLGLDDEVRTEQDLIRAMVENPVLIERPILVAGAKAVVGRPPERVLDIVD